ncbi:hypothetical protein [Flagellimonas onchidii]|uniref:hypothetical protein n=1 Tax=Flagellimonas onchidii TaxID=2562684 RepID=UPI0010A6B07D|nr:hypothetical protein [Allomuricauda onchidii]
MGSILDNPSRLNSYVVRTGMRIDHGTDASAYLVFKKLERRVKRYVNSLKTQYDHTKVVAAPSAYNITKTKYNQIVRYLDSTQNMCLTKLDGISNISRLEDYLKIQDTNKMIYSITGRNITIKIDNILN